MTVWLPVVGMLALAALLVRAGLRGRRIGSEPFCRKCEYQLTGIQSARCPECGTELNERAIVHGVRKRSWGLVALAVVMPLAFPPTWTLIGKARSNWYAVLPLRVLRELVDRGSLRAGSELHRRVSGGELTNAEIVQLYGHSCAMLRKQVPPLTRSNWRTYVSLVMRQNVLTQAQMRVALPDYSYLQLLLRPVIREDDPLPMRRKWVPLHQGIDYADFSHSSTELWCDDESVSYFFPEYIAWRAIAPGKAASLDYGPVVLRMGLRPGEHRIEYFGENELSSSIGTITYPVSAQAKVIVLDRDAPDPVQWVDAPHLSGELAQVFIVKPGCGDWSRGGGSSYPFDPPRWYLRFTIELCDSVSVPIAFSVKLEINGHLHDAWGWSLDPAIGRRPTVGILSGQDGDWPGSAGVRNWSESDDVYIVLEGSKDVARSTVDMFRVWNGTIRLGPFRFKKCGKIEVLDAKTAK